MTTRDLGDLRKFLEHHLRHHIMPFWFKHALPVNNQGGINTCLADDGSLLSEDKYMWSQLRAIYTFSAMYNHVDRDPKFLEVAIQVADFAQKFGKDEQGRWVFAVTKEGKPHIGHTSIYADGFAIMGFTELYNATGDPAHLNIALETYRSVKPRLDPTKPIPVAPYDTPPGLKTHGISMIFSIVFHELAKAAKDAQLAGDLEGDIAKTIAADALSHANQVMGDYLKPEQKALLEYVKLDGSIDDSPQGRTIVPGHAIESMWFQIHQFQDLGMHEQSRQAVAAVQWHMDRGWDEEFGGIVLGQDIKGLEPFWKFPDAKLWWPQTEALYALLLSHDITGEPWCLDWYWKLHDVAFTHYPDKDHGEWYQRLDRKFQLIKEVVALPVKDPFHLPRALIMCIKLLKKMGH